MSVIAREGYRAWLRDPHLGGGTINTDSWVYETMSYVRQKGRCRIQWYSLDGKRTSLALSSTASQGGYGSIRGYTAGSIQISRCQKLDLLELEALTKV